MCASNVRAVLKWLRCPSRVPKEPLRALVDPQPPAQSLQNPFCGMCLYLGICLKSCSSLSDLSMQCPGCSRRVHPTERGLKNNMRFIKWVRALTNGPIWHKCIMLLRSRLFHYELINKVLASLLPLLLIWGATAMRRKTLVTTLVRALAPLFATLVLHTKIY